MKMKKTTTISLVLLACVLVHQADAWPLSKWFEDENKITTMPTTPEPPTTTMPLPTEERPSFWTSFYNTIKAVLAPFFSLDNANDPSNISYSISTYEPFSTLSETTTEEIEDEGYFQGFFASLANSFTSIYDRFYSQLTNSTQEVASDAVYYPTLFAEEVDALFQNFSLPMADLQDITNLKASIVDALVSAWNTSLELGEIPVVNPHEIQNKILETLQVAEIFPNEISANDTKTVMPSRPSPATLNPDEIGAKFLEILKKEERSPDGISGVFTEPSSSFDERKKWIWG